MIKSIEVVVEIQYDEKEMAEFCLLNTDFQHKSQ